MEGCTGKCAKYFLVIFNLLFVLTGAGILGLGIWIRVSENVSHIEALLNVAVDNYLYIAAYIIIGVGVFVFIVGFLGCCGALTEKKCLLVMYVAFLVVIFAAEFSGGIIGVVYKNDMIGELKEDLKVTFTEYKPRTNTSRENAVALAWDYIQVWFECCGANNYTDYYGAVNFSQPGMYVPMTCCVLNNTDPENPQPYNAARCQETASNPNNVDQPSDYMWTKNCFEGVEETLKKNSNIFIGVTIGIAFFQLMGIILACCVCRSSNYKRIY